ncbi:uncharacterized protein LOC133849372 [Drosophila sulfurigaster albostrigata]|uniref:uncharacterized protein LOC133849372 n=1 Tax=Drosophila sulfurigaster albostrigata TaxID=89887 RepID=UPI002D21CCF6|nr:uncharacterized protein LOC133849372 [Drosophila sulfurigaster albostrigata]
MYFKVVVVYLHSKIPTKSLMRLRMKCGTWNAESQAELCLMLSSFLGGASVPPSTFHRPPSAFHVPHSVFRIPHSPFHCSPASLSGVVKMQERESEKETQTAAAADGQMDKWRDGQMERRRDGLTENERSKQHSSSRRKTNCT